MSIGNTVNYSIPVVGTTVGDFSRSNNTNFLESYTAAGGSYAATLTIRPSAPISTQKRFGVSAKVRPSDVDDPGTFTKGGCTVSINIDAVPGSVMTKAEICEFARYSLSTALHSNLLEDLYDGNSL